MEVLDIFFSDSEAICSLLMLLIYKVLSVAVSDQWTAMFPSSVSRQPVDLAGNNLWIFTRTRKTMKTSFEWL